MSSETSATPAPVSATYNAACHCGRFKYTVTASPPLDDPSAEVGECNCSICTRNGYLLIYVPAKNIVFEKGSEEEFSKYTFAPKHRIAHYFCPSCGTSAYCKSNDPTFFADTVAVNVRPFEGIDLKSLKLKFMDGKSYNPDEGATGEGVAA